jgi:hypothetical protein
MKVECKVLKAMTKKIMIFWVAIQCSLVHRYQHLKGTCCLHCHGERHPENGGVRLL